jgi:hypothetical protein
VIAPNGACPIASLGGSPGKRLGGAQGVPPEFSALRSRRCPGLATHHPEQTWRSQNWGSKVFWQVEQYRTQIRVLFAGGATRRSRRIRPIISNGSVNLSPRFAAIAQWQTQQLMTIPRCGGAVDWALSSSTRSVSTLCALTYSAYPPNEATTNGRHESSLKAMTDMLSATHERDPPAGDEVRLPYIVCEART